MKICYSVDAHAKRDSTDCAQALRNRELWRLGEKLLGAAQMDLSTPMGVAELDSTVSRIVSAVEQLVVAQKTTDTTTPTPGQAQPDDAFSLAIGTRWLAV